MAFGSLAVMTAAMNTSIGKWQEQYAYGAGNSLGSSDNYTSYQGIYNNIMPSLSDLLSTKTPREVEIAVPEKWLRRRITEITDQGVK